MNTYANEEKGSATVIAIAVIALLVLGGGGYYLAMQSQESMESEELSGEDLSDGASGAAGTMLEGSVLDDEEGMVGGDARVDGEVDIPVLEDEVDADADAVMDTEEESGAMADTEVRGVVYENFEAAKVAEAAARGDVVLFFHASWCPTCRAADTAIQSGLSDADGLTILKTDYDTETELRQKYGVTTQHTFVQIDASGNEIAQWTGTNTVADIAAKVQ